LAVFILTLLPVRAAETATAQPFDFTRDIETVLIKRCTECHGPDEQKSSLRLDSKAAALKGGKSGEPLLVPGRSHESELFRRITSDDPDEVMPSKGERLTAQEIARFKFWIDQGAVWPERDPRKHWSYQPPVRQPAPEVGGAWAKTDIDRFVLARLQKESLTPSPEADRATLIRRLSLDITGLPPSIAEVDQFLHDSSPNAYEKVVNRLFGSPHHGEHLARWWLDLARYADSNGYQVDLARSIWPYRQWVIEAFNRNMPFDQFTVEQLAGDLLPNATLQQKIATGFNRNTKINDEGGGDAEEYRTKAVKDRVATTATTWLGLTMMCAECHTHKYDPITHEDYYRFYAFFNNSTDGGNYSLDPTLPVPPPKLDKAVAYVRGRLEELQRQLAASDARVPAEQPAWEKRIATKLAAWKPLTLTNALSTGGSVFTNLPDQSILSTGVNPIYDTITVEAITSEETIAAILLEVLPDPSLPKNGPGRWGQTGNFILDDMGVTMETPGTNGASPVAITFKAATADWEQDYYRAEHALDRNPKTGWAIGPQFGKRHFLIAELSEPMQVAAGTKLVFKFEHYHGSSHTIGRMRLSTSSETSAEALWPVDSTMAAILNTAPGQRSSEQKAALTAHYRASLPQIRTVEREIVRLNQREAQLAAQKHTTLVMQERSNPRETYIHQRGNFLDKGKAVTPGVPEILPPLPADEPANRLALARWLVNPAHPLTARVTVNRLWERFFGTGLVKTSDDFGRQGEAPSHPELLDWLASELVRLNWDLRAIQKQIVLSATYRQSAAVSPELLEKDFYNRLLARGPRFRMDAEMIRDNALAVSGLLNRDIGGPSVHPVQPANLWKEIGFLRPEIGMDEWPLSEGPDLYRRGVYTFWRRVCTYPTFATFDAPSRDVCAARRPRTNTPLQALAALNEPTLLEAARVLAQRIMLEGGSSVEQKVEFAFRLCLARKPESRELKRIVSLFEQQVRGFAQDRESAGELIDIGSAPRPPELETRQLAAWMVVANVLLNLDETITKE
jgi:hypothetical protein